ncbi:hypothetical protein [Streptomyces sp. NPDC101776]|uniref:hypothetical protein n=1 Tax=Streptomyces sp. NPDC101776 TaxID=3366146 RepID=UPI0037FED220
MGKISAAQADTLLDGAWFDGYTKVVDVYDELVTVDDFDAAARAVAHGGTEMVLFGNGLTVLGTLDLSDGVHSIFAVQGVLRARHLILGDALLVVQGTVELDEWLFGPESEGLFAVGNRQIEGADQDAMLANVRAPVIALFDRNRREFVLREHGERRETAQLTPELLDGLDPDESPELILGDRLRAHLLDGQPVFR